LTAPIDAVSRPASFTLVVTGFVPAWRRASALPPFELPTLTRMVRRGVASRSEVSSPGWKAGQLRLLALLGLDAEARHGGAALEWLGLGGEPRLGGWLRAEFVHLEVGSHDARLHVLTGLDAEDAAELASALVAGLQYPGLSVLPSSDPRACPGVFLHSDGGIHAACQVPAFDDLVELRDVLPQGKDGPTLRRLFTEAQMLLHEHPVNVARERRKLRAANAIWLTGASEYAGVLPVPLPAVASGGPYLNGLCRLHGGRVLAVPASATAADLPALVELPALGDADPAPELDRLERDWFAPLADALGAGRIGAVVIQLDDLEVRIDRAALRRFWRRGPTLKELLR
jgi:hypothetical protein